MWKAVKGQKWLILYVLVIIIGLFYFGQKYQNNVKAAEIDEAEQVEQIDSVMGVVPKKNGKFTGNLTVSQQMKLINQLVNLDPRFYNYSQYKENEGLDYLFYKDPLSFVLVVQNNLNFTKYSPGHRFYDMAEGGRVYRFDDDMQLMYSFDGKEFDTLIIDDSKIEYFYSSLIGGEYERFFPLISQLNGTTLGINDYLQLDADYSDYKYTSEFPRSVDNSSKNVDYKTQKKLLSKLIELEPNFYDYKKLIQENTKVRYIVTYNNNKYQIAVFNSIENFYDSSSFTVNSTDMAIYTFDGNGEYMYKNGEDSYWGYKYKNVIYSNFYGTSRERLWKMLEYMDGTPENSSGIIKIPEKNDENTGGDDSQPSEQDPQEEEQEEEKSGLGLWFSDLWDAEKYKFDNDFIQLFSLIGMYSKLFNFNYHLWNGGAPSEAQIEQLGPYWAEYIRPSYGLAAFEIKILGVRIPFTEMQSIISEKTYWVSMIFRSLITFSTVTYCYNKLRQTFAPMY